MALSRSARAARRTSSACTRRPGRAAAAVEVTWWNTTATRHAAGARVPDGSSSRRNSFLYATHPLYTHAGCDCGSSPPTCLLLSDGMRSRCGHRASYWDDLTCCPNALVPILSRHYCNGLQLGEDCAWDAQCSSGACGHRSNANDQAVCCPYVTSKRLGTDWCGGLPLGSPCRIEDQNNAKLTMCGSGFECSHNEGTCEKK